MILIAATFTVLPEHADSTHFKQAQEDLPPHLARTPQVGNVSLPQDDWSELGEMAVGN